MPSKYDKYIDEAVGEVTSPEASTVSSTPDYSRYIDEALNPVEPRDKARENLLAAAEQNPDTALLPTRSDRHRRNPRQASKGPAADL